MISFHFICLPLEERDKNLQTTGALFKYTQRLAIDYTTITFFVMLAD